MRALKAGARGYIMKQEAVEKVWDAILKVGSSEGYLSNAVSKRTVFGSLGRDSGAVCIHCREN